MTDQEIDERVAEVVMGWVKCRADSDLSIPRWWHKSGVCLCLSAGGRHKFKAGDSAPLNWNPTRDIKAAWEVVEKMTEYGKRIALVLRNEGELLFEADFGHGYCAEDLLAPKAISLAALAVLEAATKR